MQWTTADDILAEAMSLVGALGTPTGDTLRLPRRHSNAAYPAPDSLPTIVDQRDSITKTTDQLLEEWTGMRNPILEAAEELRINTSNLHVDVRPIDDDQPTEVRQTLVYDKGIFYKMQEDPIPADRMVSPASEVALQAPITEEELQKQGDMICEAVHWLLVSERKDRAIEETEALVVRARLSEIVQCNGVIDLIQNEVDARLSTIALIQTQIAQLNDLRARALRNGDQYITSTGSGGDTLSAVDDDQNRDELDVSGRGTPTTIGYARAHKGGPLSYSTGSPTTSEPIAGSRGRRTPVGPTPPPTATRLKMLSFAQGNHAAKGVNSIAAAEQVLRAASASAGPLRAAALSIDRSNASQYLHHERHLAAMDAKISAKVTQIDRQNPIF